MHPFLHWLSSQNYIAKLGAVDVNQRFLVIESNVKNKWQTSFLIYKTIHNI